VDAPYQAPPQPEVHLHTLGRPADELAAEVLATLVERGVVTTV
jgi:bifunctional enzyme CysN/CysC